MTQTSTCVCVLCVWDRLFKKVEYSKKIIINLLFEAAVMGSLDHLEFTKNLRNLRAVWHN